MLTKTTVALLSCFALLGLAGCGGGPETAPVTGTVTLKLAPHILPLPAALHDCARSVGVDLTATAKGSRITWRTAVSGRTDLAMEVDPEVPWKAFVKVQDAAAGAKFQQVIRIVRAKR